MFAMCAATWANEAQIVLLTGKADTQLTTDLPWSPAQLQQRLPMGTWIRTGSASQVGLLLRDQTQVRLGAETILRLSVIAESGPGTSVDLARGRLWAQAKQFVSGSLRGVTSLLTSPNSERSRLLMHTPTSTIGIRGTDWEVVADDNSTTVTVLSGEVEVSNEAGSISVAANEQAVALRGKAPTKILLTNARDRVQWVTAYRPDPRRWVPVVPPALAGAVRSIEAGDYAAALAALQIIPPSIESHLLLADLQLHQGLANDAIALLTPIAQGGTGDPMAVALLARALVIAGKTDEARFLLTAATGPAAAQQEVVLARADLARLGGEAELALRLFTQVANVAPGASEAWFGVGRVQTEKELIERARASLNEAIRLSPDTAGYRGELATLEALAGNLSQSRAAFGEALRLAPDDYLALTGLGILELKSGNAPAALQAFLKAGVIEPRFARAQLYTGVAYYQLGNTHRAYEAVRKAAELDAKDPLPYIMLSLMYSDDRALGSAVEAAREAQLRLPYLKSLNQLLNDQKGSANIGSSLAAFGMEEWATYYAYAAYSPYWAGSHLFLADRSTGEFNKNSELFKGFITDPTVFGASNRASSLITTPGHYGRIDLFAERTNWAQGAVIGTVNGLWVEPFPIAYTLSADFSGGSARKDASTSHGDNLTLGLGAKPRYDIAVFAFGTDTTIRSTLRSASLPGTAFEQRENRADAGINLKLAPDNQIWLKAGGGRQHNTVAGPLVSQASADSLGVIAAPFVFSPAGDLAPFDSSVTQHDAQFRHAFTVGNWLWTWGAEHSRQQRSGTLATNFTGQFFGLTAISTISTTDTYSMQATDAYLGARYNASEAVLLEGALFGQRGKTRRTSASSLSILVVGFPPPIFLPVTASDLADKSAEVNPRVGVQWRVAEGQTVRMAWQKWRRPGSAGTLAPIDTVGIALNDRLPMAGGLYQRARMQYDAELNANTFAGVFVDSERVDNGLGGARNAIADFEVSQLQNLRSRQDVFSPKSDVEATPVFGAGTLRTLGLAANHRLGSDQTLSLRYLYRDSQQRGVNAGLAIPYIPRHYLLLGSQWALGGHWLLGVNTAWRSARFRDDTALDPIAHGWSHGLTLFWEADDKRANVQLLLDNLLSRRTAGDKPDPHVLIRLGYRF